VLTLQPAITMAQMRTRPSWSFMFLKSSTFFDVTRLVSASPSPRSADETPSESPFSATCDPTPTPKRCDDGSIRQLYARTRCSPGA